MKSIWKAIKGLNWHVLIALPVLSILLGIANNFLVPEDQRVRWSGDRVAYKSLANEESSTGDGSGVIRGAWTENFDAATNAAITAHVPLVVVLGSNLCGHCTRLHEVLQNDSVKEWQKEKNWYFVDLMQKKTPEIYAWMKALPGERKSVPMVGVYWARPDGTLVKGVFSGRRDMMGGGEEDASLEEMFMKMVEGIVAGEAPRKKEAQAPESYSVGDKIITTGVELVRNAKGRVKVLGRSGRRTRKQIRLKAEAEDGSLFVGWRCPTGEFVPGRKTLTVGTHMPVGKYTAIFRKPEDCAAPILNIPTNGIVCALWKMARYQIHVNKDAYPVTFSCRGLPPGMELSGGDAGVITGVPETNGVWNVEVMVKSVTIPDAVASGTLRINVSLESANSKTHDAEVEMSRKMPAPERGVWTHNFVAATNLAAAAHIPVVVLVESEGCIFCERLARDLSKPSVAAWQKARGWYFVSVKLEDSPMAAKLVKNTPNKITGAPYVGVYWSRPDGKQQMSNFLGRHRRMGVPKNKSLAHEWVMAVEKDLAGAPGLDGGRPASDFFKNAEGKEK